MEPKLAAGLRKWKVTEFIVEQGVQTEDLVRSSALQIDAGFKIEFFDQVDDVEEPPAALISDGGPCDADGKVGFASACAT